MLSCGDRAIAGVSGTSLDVRVPGSSSSSLAVRRGQTGRSRGAKGGQDTGGASTVSARGAIGRRPTTISSVRRTVFGAAWASPLQAVRLRKRALRRVGGLLGALFRLGGQVVRRLVLWLLDYVLTGLSSPPHRGCGGEFDRIPPAQALLKRRERPRQIDNGKVHGSGHPY